MTSQFKVYTTGGCTIKVTDCSDYASESVLSSYGYTFMQTCTVNVLRRMTDKDTYTVVTSDIQQHYLSEDGVTQVIDESSLDFGEDGLYEINHIILPNTDWFDTYKGNVLISSVYSNGIYITDGEKIYKYINNSLEEVPVEQLVVANPVNTTISIGSKNTFSVCHLKECYYAISKKLLNEICPLACSKDEFKEDEFNRDLIWMALNVIRYCLDLGQYYEALRFLKQIQGCGNVCPQYTETTVNHTGCGCSR